MQRNPHLPRFFGAAALCLLCATLLSAQPSHINLDRNSYTILYTADPKGAGQWLQKGLNMEFSRRFDWNSLPTKTFSPAEYGLTPMAAQLTREGIGRQLMAFWWHRQPDGSFRLDTIARRGLFNARAMEIEIAKTGPRGNAQLEESGLRLIPRSYVVVLRPRNLRTMTEVYDEQDRKARESDSKDRAKRILRGYQGDIEAYAFQLRYDSLVKNAFYAMWPFEDDQADVRRQKAEAFDRYPFQLNTVRTISIDNINSVAAVDAKFEDLKKGKVTWGGLDEIKGWKNGYDPNITDAELLQGWAAKAVNKVFEQLIESHSTVMRDRRTADLGRKDGIHTEKRYVVYELVQRRDGSMRLVRKAVLRSTNDIANNYTYTAGTDLYTRFYRVGGLGRIQPGMVIKERREAGIGVHALYTLGLDGQMSDLGAGGEINLSLYLAKFGMKRVPTSLRFGANYTWARDTIWALGTKPLKADATRLSVYLRKDIPFLSILRLGLWAGYGSDAMTETTKEDKKKSLTTAIVPVGAEFGINIFRGVNAFAQAERAFPVGDVMEGKKSRSDLDWAKLYPRRMEVVARAGLRVTF